VLIWLLLAACTFAESFPDSTRYVIPASHYSVAEEVSPDFEAALSHFQVERVYCAPARSHTVRINHRCINSYYIPLALQ
jgi:hypothetical protein